MRPVSGITDAELNAVVSFLSNPTQGVGRGAPNLGPLPPGPVVASGGVRLPPRPLFTPPVPSYGGVGGTGGNVAYPDDIAVPPVRYVTEYGVMASATKPPYTTLTAYDLNAGTIRWQVPLGDDLATLAAGGPPNTGGLGARNGMVVTKAGIVFVAGSDRRVRAYDEDNGHVLWTGALPGSASGIPVSYEAKGRQYVVISSLATGARVALSDTPPETPRGYIAFALPR
jgi:quinoprotein glucose dehydrogenase